MHYKRCLGLILVVFVVLFLSCVQPTASRQVGPQPEPPHEKVRLQWKWSKNSAHRYKTIQQMTQKVFDTPQGNVESSINSAVIHNQQVTEVDEEGTATIRFKYESFQIEMNDPRSGRTSFDSNKEEDILRAQQKPELLFYPALLKGNFTVKISQAGDVLEVTGIDRLKEEVLKEEVFKQIKDDPRLAQMMNTFTDETIKKTIQQSFTQLPKEPIGVGERWSASVMTFLGESKYTYLYTSNEVIGKRNCALLDIQMDTIKLRKDNPLVQMFEVELAAPKGKKSFYFDAREGLMVKYDSELKISGTLIDRRDPTKNKMKMELDVITKIDLME